MSESRLRRWFASAVTALALSALAATAEAQPFVYVLTKVPGTPWQQYLTVIDPATHTKGSRIQLGRSNGYLLTQAMAMAPDGALIYVANDYDQSVSVVSTATNAVVDTLPTSLVGRNPWALAVSPDTQTLYVAGNSQVLVAIDVASRTRLAAVTHNQGGATGIAVSPDGERVYMTASAEPTRLVVFSTAPLRVANTRELPGVLIDASALTVSPNGRFLYIPQRPFNAGGTDNCPPGVDCVSLTPPGSTPPGVLILDTATNQFVAKTPVGRWPFHVGVSPNGATVYATDYSSTARTHRLDPATHASLGTVASAPRGFVMAFLPDSSRAYVAGNLTVSVIDTTTHAVTATIPFVASTDGRALGIVTTPPPYVVPDPPSNLRATVTGNRVVAGLGSANRRPPVGLRPGRRRQPWRCARVSASRWRGDERRVRRADRSLLPAVAVPVVGGAEPGLERGPGVRQSTDGPGRPVGVAGPRQWRRPRPQLEARVRRRSADVARRRRERRHHHVGGGACGRDALLRRGAARHLHVRRACPERQRHQPGVVARHAQLPRGVSRCTAERP